MLQRTAADNRAFLLGWFERFPQFRSNPFWLSGEGVKGRGEQQHAVQGVQRACEGRRKQSLSQLCYSC